MSRNGGMPRMYATRARVRDLDRQATEQFNVPSILLMENPGRGAAELLRSLGLHSRVTICCGKGNNGGDGLVMARHLDYYRVPVQVLLFIRPEELTGDAAMNYAIVARSGIALRTYAPDAVEPLPLKRELARAEWVVDALFGTGLQG